MSATAFHRARTEEQREQRREAILATAREMLEDTRVPALTLNELARRTGLAKSNVLRYFESREAVLLELYDREYRAWLDALEAELSSRDGDPIEVVAAAIADTASVRPILCELCASAPGVLERNVSADVAAEYKRQAIASARRLAGLAASRLGPFTEAAGIGLVSGVNLMIGGVWASTQPSPGMAAAYAEHPELASMRHDFRLALRELVATLLTGLAHREPTPPFEDGAVPVVSSPPEPGAR